MREFFILIFYLLFSSSLFAQFRELKITESFITGNDFGGGKKLPNIELKRGMYILKLDDYKGYKLREVYIFGCTKNDASDRVRIGDVVNRIGKETTINVDREWPYIGLFWNKTGTEVAEIKFSLWSIKKFNKVYCSSSYGDDNNSGLDEFTPLKSIHKALLLGDTVLLKNGDVFYESVTLTNQVLSFYGVGKKPIVCGFKRIEKRCWIRAGKNLWKICLSDDNFSGVNTKGSSELNNVGCIYEWDKDKIHGRKVQYKKDLLKNWDFWQTYKFSKLHVKPTDFDSLYLYCNEDPNTKKMEFSVGCNGVNMSYSTLKGIEIKGFGCHGIAGGTESIISNCSVDVIGGMCQIGYDKYTSLGNGIEFYISKDKRNCSVRNCIISRCYDSGITIQGADQGNATPRNIIIERNLIKECCQGWEDFLRNDSNVMFENCIVRENIFLNNGVDNGFGYPDSRFKYCQILGNNCKGNKGLILEHNIFIGGNYYCSGAYRNKYKSHIWRHNKCYLKKGDFILSNYTGSADVIRIPKEKGTYPTIKLAIKAAISAYREKTGDRTTEFFVLEDKDIKREVYKHLKKFNKSK